MDTYISSFIPSSEKLYLTYQQLKMIEPKSLLTNLRLHFSNKMKLFAARVTTKKESKDSKRLQPSFSQPCSCSTQVKEYAPIWCIEPYVDDGYLLQNKPLSYYMGAIFTYNYEMMNVWTSIIPMFYFIYMLLNFYKELDLVKTWPLLAVTFGSISVELFSGFAHMFHSRSINWHNNCFLMDYFGIMVFASSSTVANFFASASLQHYNWLKSRNLFILVMNSFLGFLCMAITQMEVGPLFTLKLKRILKVGVNLFGYLYGMWPIFSRIQEGVILYEVKCYYILQLLFMTLNPILYASDFPQRFWPGKFDVFFHSHQLFHVSVACACYFNVLAVYKDVTEGTTWSALRLQPDYPTLYDFMKMELLMIISCGLTILWINTRYKKMKQK